MLIQIYKILMKHLLATWLLQYAMVSSKAVTMTSRYQNCAHTLKRMEGGKVAKRWKGMDKLLVNEAF